RTTGNTVCSINDCISSALERYPFSTSAERELVHWEPTENFELLGRPLSVIHILFNLIKNALYFIAKAGKGDIKIWLEKSTKYNKLHFKDTGYGIASDILPGIFDQFSTTTTDGTGIGLTFCKVAMQNMHGSISCNSKEGEYTEFVLRFPKHKK
ncbi:MAG: HAMP domain-containing histidine kinase, partial [Gammaproteobacteria bacterium]|nr:HAMP domain-containing histidine kinase [Gammaproteobacteria bacterium]